MLARFKLTIIGLALLLLAVPALSPAATPAAKASSGAVQKNGAITLDFKDIDLQDLVQTMSELMDRNFVYDDTLRGKVTIISPRAMSLDEAYQVFQTVLGVKGYTIVPSGAVNKVVALKDAKESNLPTVSGTAKEAPGEQFVTRLVPLENADATVLASTVLAQLIPKTSNIVAYPPTNTLIISDSSANIDRLLTIIKELDGPGALNSVEVIPLKDANADEVAVVLTQILSEANATPTTRRRRTSNVQAGGQKEVSKVIPYPRGNLLVALANADDLAMISSLVAQLDQPPTQDRSFINVYYLENADAETLAKTLNEIITGSKAPTTPRGGAPAATQAALTKEAVSITADKPTNALIVNSTPEDYETIKGIIKQLDVKRKQVFVEALVLELSMDATRKIGASLQAAGSSGSDSLMFGTSNLNTGSTNLSSVVTSTSGVPSLLTQTIDGILLGGLFNPVTVTGPDGTEVTVPALSALIDLSKKDADVNILSAPRLLTSDNEEAEIVVGSNVPIITSRLTNAVGSATSTSSGLATSVSVERKDVALTLRFTPQITEGDRVRLNLYQEITDIASTSVGDPNQVGPTFTKRLLRNTVLAENGKTVVLGGLIGHNVQTSITKVPLLGDIPGLGWLFKRKSTTDQKTNILIFITPRIIRDANDLAEVTDHSRRAMEDFQQGILPTGAATLQPAATDAK